MIVWFEFMVFCIKANLNTPSYCYVQPGNTKYSLFDLYDVNKKTHLNFAFGQGSVATERLFWVGESTTRRRIIASQGYFYDQFKFR